MEFQEHLEAFLRKIKSLGTEFHSMVEERESYLEAPTTAFSTAKEWEKQVTSYMVNSIKEIDKKITSYEYFKSKSQVECQLREVVQNCLDQIKKQQVIEIVNSIKEIEKKISSDEYYTPKGSDGVQFYRAFQSYLGQIRKQQVMIEIVKSIKEIGKKISSDEFSRSIAEVEAQLDEVIQSSLGQIEKHMEQHNHNTEKRNEDENIKEQESGVAAAEMDVEHEFVTDPYMMIYDNLEPILQRCLLSLSIFPKDGVIKKRSIIYLWIGEGLVKPTTDQTAEQVGEVYFKMLLLSDLVLPIKKKHDDTACGCKLLPKVRQMLTTKAGKAGKAGADCLFRNFSERNLPRNDSDCPLSFFGGTQKKEQEVVISLDQETKQIVSLFNSSAQYIHCKKSAFSRLKSIKVLQLGRWEFSAERNIEIADEKFLDSLQVMKKLTYLGLEGISGITSLDLKHLHSLCILNLRACHHLEKLSADATSLKNLTHLDVSECPLIDRMPRGLQNLSELQVLKGFTIAREDFTDSCQLKDLIKLRRLRKLSIDIRRHVKPNAHLKCLDGFASLRSLTITWGRADEDLSWCAKSIEKLHLRRIRHDTLQGMSARRFPNLKKLYISGGELRSLKLSSDGTEGEWKVETLRLKFLSEFDDEISFGLRSTFPHLTCIQIWKCPKLEANPCSLPPLDKDGVWKKDAELMSSWESRSRE